jgi:glucose/arabinose dehydrogenase
MKKMFVVLAVFLVILSACAPLNETAAPPPKQPTTVIQPPEPTIVPTVTVTPEIPPTPTSTAAPFKPLQYKLVEAYPNLTFEKPLGYEFAIDGTNRVFVVQQTGKIIVLDNSADVSTSQVFINLRNRINLGGSEKGLLGLAFHPDYKNNGFFFVNYTNATNTVIARYQVNPSNPNEGLYDSEKVVLTFHQPYANHNGGQLVFGPDGYLYIGAGDGGSGGDPHKNGQNLKTFLGKILRIDVDKPNGDKLYSIPTDNPFVGNSDGYFEEIYAYGLRNPWRFSFDLPRGLLWAGDVGQDTMEEVDLIEKGKNYGWNIMEGTLDFSPSSTVNKDDLVLPISEYNHSLGESITGGFVYYGNLTPSLKGVYIYGDFISGRIWALWLDKDLNPFNYELMDTDLNISTFGVDQNGELVIVDYNGKIYRLVEVN